jgi:hypothetical protein
MRAMHRGRSRGNPGSETRRECTMQQDSRRGEFACGLGERPRCGTLFKFAQVGVPSAKKPAVLSTRPPSWRNKLLTLPFLSGRCNYRIPLSIFVAYA